MNLPLDSEVFPDLTNIGTTSQSLVRILENYKNEIYLFSVNDLTFKYVSRTARQNLGYSASELRMMTPLDLKLEMSKEEFRGILADLRSHPDHSSVFETIHQRKDSSRYPVQVYLQMVRLDGQDFYLANILDLTIQKQTEKALSDSEYTFRRLYEASVEPIMLLRDGRFMMCNEATLKILRTTDQDLVIGHTPGDISPDFQPDGRTSIEAAHARINEAFQSGKEKFDWLLKCFDGAEVTVEVTLVPIIFRSEEVLHVSWHDITKRKKMEEALRHSEVRFRLLIENSPQTIALVSLEGKFLYVSPNAFRILGYQPDEMEYLSPNDLTHPDDLPMVLEELTFIIQNPDQVRTCQYRFLSKDKQWRWIESTFTNLLAEPAISAIVINFRDIHEQRCALDDLKRREEDLRQLFEEGITANYISTPEGRLLKCNPAFVRMLGYESEEELLNLEMDKIYPGPSDRSEFINKLLRTKRLENSEIDLVRKDGAVVHCIENVTALFNDEGELTRFQGFMFDITDRKRAETIQQIQYRIAQAAVSSANLQDLLTVTRNELSKLIDTNNFFVAFFDKGKDTLREAFSVDERDEIDEWPASQSLSGLVVKKGATFLLRKEAIEQLLTENHIQLIGAQAECWLGVPLTDENVVIGIMVVQSYDNPNAFDRFSAHLMEIISHELVLYIRRERAEKDLVAAKEHAEESERLKSAFLANMSHEIRTPMNAIVGFADMLLDPEILPEERAQFSGIIKSRSDDLLRLINDILDISRIESGNAAVDKGEIRLNGLLTEIELVTRQKLARSGKTLLDLELRMPMPDGLDSIVSDVYILRQVFNNLLDNAIKYTPSGHIIFGYEIPADGRIVFYVTDTGIGIDPQYHDVVFKTFRQANVASHHQFGGTGLGLAICKGSLELLGGKISLDSMPGRGTTFRFSVPFERPRSLNRPVRLQSGSGITEPSKASSFFDWADKKIIVVEDEPSNLEYIKRLLAPTRARLFLCENGASLREYYPSISDFDLILLDIRLPDANGLDLAEEIRKIPSAVPIIAQTAFAMTGDREMSLDAGCDAYISKPISRSALFSLIASFFNPAS